MVILLCCIAALLAGFVDAIAGGGGVITFPMFMMLGLSVPEMVATNKLVSTCGTLAASITFVRRKQVTLTVLKAGILPTAFGGLLGAYLVSITPNDLLKPLVTVLIFTLALYFFFRPKLGIRGNFTEATHTLLVYTALCAFAIGMYDGFFGPGVGIIWTFFFVRVAGMDFVLAAGNTKVLNLISNLVPLVYFVLYGRIRYDIAIPMVFANVVGGMWGARVAMWKGAGLVRWVYIGMALLLAVKLLVWG